MLSWPLRGLASDGVASLSPAERAAQRELAVVRLLQGSAKAPEDLLWTAIDLLRLGLLSKETAKALCASLGITADTLEALLEAGAVAESPTVLVPASGQHAGTAVLSDMVQQAIAGAGPSARSPPIERPVFGLSSLGLQSRLAAEFVLLRKLGHGAMGSVFHARHRLDGAQYAIKIVPFFVRANGEPSAVTPEAERVLREVQALSRLNHPNVCRYHNAWVETDWASLWQGQPAAGHGAKTAPGYARLPLLLTGIASEPSADDSFSSDDGTWTQSESLSGGAGFVRRAGRGSHRDGSSDGESSFSFSPESAEHVSSFPSASLPSGSLDEVSAVDTKGMYNHNALRTPAPSVGRSWSYRKALLIQMELCEHATLHEYLSARDASLSARGNAGADGINKEESLGLLLQIVSGLEHVHACGLVHRDLKPANCCFQNGALKLLDFGLAKAHDGLEGYAHEHSGCASEAGATTSGHMPLSGSTRTVGNADRVEGYADDHDGCESGAGARVCGPEYSPRGTPMVGDGELPVLSTSADCIEQIETGSHSAAEKGMPDAAAGKSAAALSQGKRSVASAPRPAPEASCPVAATAKGVASCAGSSHPADCETAQRRPNERGRGSAGAKDRGIAGGRGTCGAAQRARVGVGTAGVGTASYSAPEQLEYGVARAHCDMFPLGLMA
jgi:serine/threonine protein kinase